MKVKIQIPNNKKDVVMAAFKHEVVVDPADTDEVHFTKEIDDYIKARVRRYKRDIIVNPQVEAEGVSTSTVDEA
jgi:hypothetical protein